MYRVFRGCLGILGLSVGIAAQTVVVSDSSMTCYHVLRYATLHYDPRPKTLIKP